MSASAVVEGSPEEAAGAEADSPPPKGWEVAAEAIKLALNNRVEDAQDLLDQSKASCVHRQAGYCYLAFIVSTYFYLLTYMQLLYLLLIVPFIQKVSLKLRVAGLAVLCKRIIICCSLAEKLRCMKKVMTRASPGRSLVPQYFNKELD